MGEAELEMPKNDAVDEKNFVNLDVNEIIGKVRDFVDNIKQINHAGQKMTVNIDGFNFSFGKADGQYDLDLKVNFVIKPKASK
jgi:hypothetical protein